MPIDVLTWTAGSLLVLVGLGIGAFFRFGPGKTLGALGDAILGEPVIRDRRGEIIDQGKPGLVSRVGTLEEAVKVLVDQDARLKNLEGRVVVVETLGAEHTAAISALIATTFERGAGQVLHAEELRQRDTLDPDDKEQP